MCFQQGLKDFPEALIFFSWVLVLLGGTLASIKLSPIAEVGAAMWIIGIGVQFLIGYRFLKQKKS
jgi:hypothetical protein